MNNFAFIDLFCGCGGFSLGMERARFRCLAAIDFNPEAVAVFKKNFPHVPHSLQRDHPSFSPREPAHLTQTKTVDVIVGVTPCQGNSTVRQRDGANSGPRMIEDRREAHNYREPINY